MNDYGEVTIGVPNPVELPVELRDGGVIDLSKSEAFMWVAEFGSGLKEGYYWSDCSECDEEVVFSPEGKPTGVHRKREQ